MKLWQLKEDLETLERCIKTRERSLKEDAETIEHFKQRAQRLKEQIRERETGQGSLL